ncbi:MAG: pyridoxamine 5'-phosphate oxidase [Actinomycetota bacterium]|nr:pyridoxamine 5'-phosphate oxidase [Actinomycetota bacterium]
MSPRREGVPPLEREGLADDPIAQLGDWYELARHEVPLPEAMTLATADADGAPNARMVLLKGFGAEGLRFFSNYESAKGAELEARPRAALIIYWRELDRQVRARGPVHKLTAAQSDEYFAGRPRDSQVAASVSPQSRPIERAELDRLFSEALEAAGEGPVARPGHWGGYALEPEEMEFWQGRDSRMHDRFRYTREGAGWRIERLAP